MLERSKDKHRPFEDSEWQANRFASAFLMPAPGLERMRAEGRLDDDEVVRAYHTSYEAAQYRISEFEAKGVALVRAWQKG
jgi:Zn-dependent peptidase ImmA (M78 family)